MEWLQDIPTTLSNTRVYLKWNLAPTKTNEQKGNRTKQNKHDQAQGRKSAKKGHPSTDSSNAKTLVHPRQMAMAYDTNREIKHKQPNHHCIKKPPHCQHPSDEQRNTASQTGNNERTKEDGTRWKVEDCKLYNINSRGMEALKTKIITRTPNTKPADIKKINKNPRNHRKLISRESKQNMTKQDSKTNRHDRVNRRHTVAHRDKTLPRMPKQFPESKTLPRIQNTSKQLPDE